MMIKNGQAPKKRETNDDKKRPVQKMPRAH